MPAPSRPSSLRGRSPRSSEKKPRRHPAPRVTWHVGWLLCLSAVALAACSGSKSSSTAASFNPTTVINTTSPADRSHGSSPTTGSTPGQSTIEGPPPLIAAIVSYQSAQSVPRGAYVITGVQMASVDPTWAKFTVDPTPADSNTFQAGYGIAHMVGTTWKVVGFGSAEVGCPPGPSVPPNVLTSLGLSCPS